MILHSDREGNDCIQKLRCHCIQILHSDINSVEHQTHGQWVVCPIDPASQCIVLKTVRFQASLEFLKNLVAIYFSSINSCQSSSRLLKEFHWPSAFPREIPIRVLQEFLRNSVAIWFCCQEKIHNICKQTTYRHNSLTAEKLSRIPIEKANDFTH